jgi:hypothetical protein
MSVCRKRAPGLPYTVTELRPPPAVVALASWSAASALIDVTSIYRWSHAEALSTGPAEAEVDLKGALTPSMIGRTTTSDTTPPTRAGQRGWLSLAVLALRTILLGLDGTVLHLAAPRAQCRDTLATAVAAAEQLPGPQAQELLELARGAYMGGVQLVAFVSAALAVLAAITATLVRSN